MTEEKSNNEIAPPQDKMLAIQRFLSIGELTSSISGEMKDLMFDINKLCDEVQINYNNHEPINDNLKQLQKVTENVSGLFLVLHELCQMPAKSFKKKIKQINSIIEELLVIFNFTKNTLFQTDLDPTIKPIPLSLQKIRQLFINIFMNAVQATKGKKSIISISTGYLHFSFGIYVKIQDNGCGMDEETRKNIFNSFYSTKKKSTGMGLASSANVMKEHNGYIRVDSEKGKGTTFTLFFLFDQFKHHPHIIDL